MNINMNKENGTYRSGPNAKNVRSGKKFFKIALGCVLGIIAIIAVTTCWFTVDEKQQAVVTTFGEVTEVVGAGIHFKAPFGIQKARTVDVNVYQTLELGYRTANNDAGYEVVESESMMITGDYNIVNVEFFVEYKISDPVKYLYSSYEPESILRNLVQSQVRNVVGSTPVDSVLTDGKEAVQMQVKELITQTLDKYDIGLMLVDVKIQDSEPPTEEVTSAFKEVETSKQNAETVVNEARAYQNAEIPAAQARVDALIQNAEYLRQSRINEANQTVAMFEAMFREYDLNPEITRKRMYYEAISEILPNVRVYLLLTENGVDTLLPLDTLMGGEN